MPKFQTRRNKAKEIKSAKQIILRYIMRSIRAHADCSVSYFGVFIGKKCLKKVLSSFHSALALCKQKTNKNVEHEKKNEEKKHTDKIIKSKSSFCFLYFILITQIIHSLPIDYRESLTQCTLWIWVLLFALITFSIHIRFHAFFRFPFFDLFFFSFGFCFSSIPTKSRQINQQFTNCTTMEWNVGNRSNSSMAAVQNWKYWFFPLTALIRFDLNQNWDCIFFSHSETFDLCWIRTSSEST